MPTTESESESKFTCSDFLDLSVAELKYFLALRGLSQEGNKLDLAARALVAYERKEPIRQDIEELRKELKVSYEKLIEKYGIKDPLKLEANKWKGEVSLWSTVDLGKIFSFIINKKAFDTEYVGHYKTKKAYSYFMSGFVNEVFVCKVSADKVILKGTVKPSQKVREDPRSVWILCTKDGDVLCAYCTCTAGFAECCNHVIAILYKIEYANIIGYVDPACTAIACVWNKTTGRKIKAPRISDLEIRMHARGKTSQKKSINSDYKKNFDVR